MNLSLVLYCLFYYLVLVPSKNNSNNIYYNYKYKLLINNIETKTVIIKATT